MFFGYKHIILLWSAASLYYITLIDRFYVLHQQLYSVVYAILCTSAVSPGKTPCCYFAERCRSSDAVGRSVGPSYTTDGGGVDQLATCDKFA